MLNKIIAYVEKWNMLKETDRVIAGVSGGADSICLLFVLKELQKQIPFELFVVHVNHQLRGECADADEAYVRDICEKHQIPCTVYSEDVAAIAKAAKQTLEEAGREVRREAFEKAMEMYGGTKIALAHHQNDNVETLFFNLTRGTGLQGLGGMQPVNSHLIRPLLCVNRKEIETYLNQEKISYCTDQSNSSDAHTRNRIRNHVIPYLEEQVNSETIAHVNDTMEYLREVQTFLDAETEKMKERCVKEQEDGYIVEKSSFEEVPKALKPLLLKMVLTTLAGKAKDIESVHLHILQELLEKQVGRKVDLPYELQAVRIYEGIAVTRRRREEEKTPESCMLEPECGKTKKCFWNGKVILYSLCDKEAWEKKACQKNNTKAFDYDIINGVVSIRTRKAGDTIYLGPAGGTQKLKSYFINQKIAQQERDRIPVLAIGNRILWLMGYRTDPAYQVSMHTKRVLEIQIEKGE